MSTNKQRPTASFSAAEVQVLDAIRLGLPQRKDLSHLVRLAGFAKLSRTVKRMADQLRAEGPRPKPAHKSEIVLAVLQKATQPMSTQDLVAATGLSVWQVIRSTNRLSRGKHKRAQCVSRGKYSRWTATVRLASVTQLSERKAAVR